MLRILLFLSVLSVLSYTSVGKLITRFDDDGLHPCERLSETQQWAQNPRGCDMYYYCENYPDFIGNARCPEGYHFHEESQECNSDLAMVGCTIDDDLWGATCSGKGASKVPHPYSCSEYTVCIDELQGDFQCEEGLHFSPYDQECVDPAVANCPIDQQISPKNYDFIPHFIPSERNCAAYYLCFNGNLQRFECGPDQHFDGVSNQCKLEADSDCDASNAIPEVELPSELTLDCTPFVNGTRVPHPEVCRFWFWCINDRSQLFWCGEGTLFDRDTRTCKVADAATCFLEEEPTEEEVEEPSEEPTGERTGERLEKIRFENYEKFVDLHTNNEINPHENELAMNFV